MRLFTLFAKPTPCDREKLSRFLDNEVSPRDASNILHHLKKCAACQTEYAQMQKMQAVLRRLPDPTAPCGGAEAARVRIMERVQRSVRLGGAPASLQAQPVSLRRLFWAGGTLGAFACAASVAFFQAPASVSVPVSSPSLVSAEEAGLTIPSATPRVPLPTQTEMAIFYDLHDAHSASLSLADPTDRRDRAAEARAALLRDTESLADNETP